MHRLLEYIMPGSPTRSAQTKIQSNGTYLPCLLAQFSDFVEIVNRLLLESWVRRGVGASCDTDCFWDIRQVGGHGERRKRNSRDR